MARDRQRAKQRQQERREQRLRERREAARERDSDALERDSEGREEAASAAGAPDRDPDRPSPAEVGLVSGETGAPPQNLGRSDATNESPPPEPILDDQELDEAFLDEEDFVVDQDELADAEAAEAGDGAEAYAPKGRRGDRAPATGEPAKGRGAARVIGFLRACWAELQRVQWPNRAQLTQLTAIVLVFIVIMGGYLGILDAIFSKVIQELI